jgi:hypothetical protein
MLVFYIVRLHVYARTSWGKEKMPCMPFVLGYSYVLRIAKKNKMINNCC